MVPLARALRDAEHEVVFVTSASFIPWVERAGFTAIPAGMNWLESAVEAAFPDAVAQMTTRLGTERAWQVIFERAAAAFIPDLVALLWSLRPDIVVSESIESTGPLAAEAVGLPYAVLGIGPWHPTPFLARTFGRSWNEGRLALGLNEDPELRQFCPYLYLDCYPPSMNTTAIAGEPPVAHPIRPVQYEVVSQPYRWLPFDAVDQPTVYVTMGTVYGSRDATLALVLDALRDEPLNLILTVGLDHDPADLGSQPAHVRIERYIPHSVVLPRVDVVVCHAGYNTTVGSLSHGIPLLALPLGSDHLDSGSRIEACGAGLMLDPRATTARRVREAVWELLRNPRYRQSAQRIQREIETMPPPSAAVDLLEHLVSVRRSADR